MEGKQKLNYMEFRRKKLERQQKDEERLNRITKARNLYLKTENVTSIEYSDQEKILTNLQKRFHDLCKIPELDEREFVNIRILNGNSPREMYLIRKVDINTSELYQHELSKEYTDEPHAAVYCLKPGFICVVYSPTKGWQRCRILKLYENSTCNVLLIDIGIIERVAWIDLRMIDERHVTHKPFAVRCSLVNVKTARPIDRYTIQQHQQFLQILQNLPDFYIFVNRSNSMSSDIFLYNKMENEFHCVNNLFQSIDTVSSDNSSAGETTTNSNTVSISNTKSSTQSEERKFSISVVEMKNVELSPSDKNSIQMVGMSSIHSNGDLPQPSNEIECFEELKAEPPQNLEPSPQIPMEQESKILKKWSETCEISKMWGASVRHIASLQEIYICFEKYVNIYKNLHFQLQTYTSKTTKQSWTFDDHCLVVDPDDTSGAWLRGKITTMASKDSCIVYLRDIGKSIECKFSKLRTISHVLKIVRDFTWKHRLAFIDTIDANELPSDPAQMLRNIIDSYEEIAFSGVQERNGNNNEKGIILWGIKKTISPYGPDKNDYININEELVKLGIATTNISFDGILSVINPPEEHIDDELIQLMRAEVDEHLRKLNGIPQQNEALVSDKRTEVKAWLPSQKYPKKNVVVFPMYVSQRCTIYVQEATHQTMADEIEKIIKKMYRGKQLEKRDPIEWKKEDPCFARFDENNFYRATLRRVNYAKDSCVVRFIDYGNCEQLALSDLRKATMFGDIPALARQFKLHNIESTTSDGSWPDYVRDFCNHIVLQKHCDLTVIEDDQQAASQKTAEVESCVLGIITGFGAKYRDLASALIRRKFARKIHE